MECLHRECVEPNRSYTLLCSLNASRRVSPLSASFKRSPLPCMSSEATFQTAEERQQLFNSIAPAYDKLNDLLSLGQHRVWKRMAVTWSRAKTGDNVLDICCGSGDLSFLLAERVGLSGKVTGLDFAKEQLAVASERQKAKTGGCYNNMRWLQGDALELPFANEEFDAITVGYGLRNVSDIPRALEEIYRVLKPGSSASILDFNRPSNMFVSQLQGWMLDNVVVPAATQFGLHEEYAYLKDSIARFPNGPIFLFLLGSIACLITLDSFKF